MKINPNQRIENGAIKIDFRKKIEIWVQGLKFFKQTKEKKSKFSLEDIFCSICEKKITKDRPKLNRINISQFFFYVNKKKICLR